MTYRSDLFLIIVPPFSSPPPKMVMINEFLEERLLMKENKLKVKRSSLVAFQSG